MWISCIIIILLCLLILYVIVPAYSSMLMVQVDQLLEYHFEEDMARLTQHCGKRLNGGRQTIIVSATLTQEVGLCLSMPVCL